MWQRKAERSCRGLGIVAWGMVGALLAAGCQSASRNAEPVDAAKQAPTAGSGQKAGVGQAEASLSPETKSCSPGRMPPVPPAQRKDEGQRTAQTTLTETAKPSAPTDKKVGAGPAGAESPTTPGTPATREPAPTPASPPKSAPGAQKADAPPPETPSPPAEASTGAQGPTAPPAQKWDPTPQLPVGRSTPAAPEASSQPGTTGVPVLELSSREFDFGEVWEGAPAKKEFTVRNAGTAPLTLSLTTSCGCTAATRPKSPLEPNETTTFSLTYATTHAGAASKTATLTTNDPNEPNVVIPVRGTVKPLFTATPSQRITFEAADVDSRETHTVRLESAYPGPVKLKLREDQDFGRFEVELKEVEPGKVYELTVTTKPPLQRGPNAAVIRMDTGLEQVPTYEVQAMAMVQPRIFAVPAQLFVTPATTQPMEQILRVQYRADRPLKILSVMPTFNGIKCELKDSPPPAPGMKMAFHQIRVTLPPYEELPSDGAKIVISTDDPAPEFARLEVPVIKRGPMPGPRAATPQ